jgi:hypothetical protein
MYTTTSLILSILPLLVSAAPPNCGSLHPTFTLEPIDLSSYYTYTTPSASGPKLGSISFTLKNDEVDYTTQCSGVSAMPLGQFYGSQIFDCTTSGEGKSSFAYDSNSKVINVNSTWSCGG